MPVWLYNNKIYHDTNNLINDLFENEYNNIENIVKPDLEELQNNDNIKKITEVAIKIKHPSVNSDIKDKIKLFNLLSWIQSKPCLKRRFGLHLDFQEFINNILQQIDFNNEKINCNRFRNNFANERLIYFPKVLYSTEDIVISEYIECDEFEEMPKYAQLMTCYNFACMVSKMMLIDNFAHLDLHHKNWKIKKLNDKDYKIIVFDYGIVYESPSIELSRKIWEAFESKNYDMMNSIVDDIIIGNITEQVRNEVNDIIKFYSTETLNLEYILSKLNSILSIHNCKLSAFSLNLALTLTLIDNVLKKHNIINNIKPVTNHDLTTREKHLDIIAFCNGKKVYQDLSIYLKKKIDEKNNANNNRFTRENIFIGTNELDLDLPE